MLKYVADTKDSLVNEMASLVNIPSLTGNEKELGEYLLKRFQGIGVDEAFIDTCGNVVAILRGEGTGPNVCLNGHMDVVFPGDLAAWAPYEPWVAKIDDEGKMHGRGVSDLKGGMACQILAFEAIVKKVVSTGKKLSGDLIFLGVVAEEPAEMMGMEYFVNHTMPDHNIKVDVVYLCEPSSNDLSIRQRGKIELVVKTKGVIAHSSAPERGINAVDKMAPVIQAMIDHDGFPVKIDPLSGLNTSTCITNIIARPGGTLSCVPDECEISIDRRYSIDSTVEDLLQEFEDLFARLKEKDPTFSATVEPRTFFETSYTGYQETVRKFHPPWETKVDNEFVQKTIKALNAVGQQPKDKCFVFGTDGSSTCALHDIPTIGYSGAPEEQAHQPQEWVEIDEMVKSYEGYISILCELYDIDLDLFN